MSGSRFVPVIAAVDEDDLETLRLNYAADPVSLEVEAHTALSPFSVEQLYLGAILGHVAKGLRES